MLELVKNQKEAFEEIYSLQDIARFNFHISKNKLTRYLRDRRLQKGIDFIKAKVQDENILDWKVLIVCGGVGGEGIYFSQYGFKNVTVSDISANSLLICNQLAPFLKTILLNGECIELDDNSYDLVVVQDGLHHLPRPVSGFTEMIRVAKKAVIVIEPYDSFIGKLIGTEWEIHENTTNFVFRWNQKMIEQTVKSYLLKNYKRIKVFRFWDHNVIIGKIARIFPKGIQLLTAKLVYSLLNVLKSTGNMMVAIVIK